MNGRSVTRAIAAASVLAAACYHGQVTLTVPDASAPLDQRIGAYRRVAPRGFQQTWGRGGVSVDFLELADGRRVYEVEDLYPVIDVDPTVARAARRSLASRSSKRLFYLATFAALGVGVFFFSRDDETLGYLAMGGTAVLAVVAYTYQVREANDRRAVFLGYEPALRARLALCVDDLALVECRPPPATQPADQ